MPADEPFEEQVGHVLRDTGGAFAPPDGSALVEGGVRRGRRRIARRRAAAVTGTVLALALVAVGGAYGSGLLGGSGAGRTVAVPRVTGPEAVTGSQPRSELTDILLRLLPEGKLIAAHPGRSGSSASVVYDDGKGPAEITVGLSYVAGRPAIPETSCPERVFGAYDSCTRSTLDDGSRLRLFRGYEFPGRKEGVRRWQATVLRGPYLVDVTAYNAPAEKGAEVSRPEPLLSLEQLRAVAVSEEWRGPLEALPTDPPGQGTTVPPATPRPGKEPPSRSAPVNVRTTFLSLLPAGAKVVDQGGQGNEYAFAVVDDGRGRSFVQINVQPGMGDVAGELFGSGAETLPDGTLVRTEKVPSEKGGAGAVMWTADTIRPDGLRVVVSALNAGGFHAPATRRSPALSMERLTAVATSGTWAKGAGRDR